LVENYLAFPIEAKKTILKEVRLGLNDIYTKHWIHLGIILLRPAAVVYNSLLTYLSLDVKPNNVFLNWYVDKKDQFQLGKVVLGDIDCALKLEG
jgi:hypothetical protein